MIGWQPYQGPQWSAGVGFPPAADQYVWPAKLVEDAYLPGPVAYQCPSFETTNDDLANAAMPGSFANWKRDYGWYKTHYGMNFTYLGTMLDAPGGPMTAANTQASPIAEDIASPSDTIYFADAKNLAVEGGSPEFGVTTGYTSGETAGIAYLFPGADAPNESYGHADARHQSAINVAYADGHGENVRVADPNEIWGPEELTDWTDTDNDWDRD